MFAFLLGFFSTLFATETKKIIFFFHPADPREITWGGLLGIETDYYISPGFLNTQSTYINSCCPVDLLFSTD